MSLDNNLLDSLSSTDILFLTIYGEARGEPIEGQIAVGCVIRNRFRTGKYKNYKEVCLAFKQFSCWNVDDANYPVLLEIAAKLFDGQNLVDPYIKQCYFVANGVINWEIMDNTHNSINYLTSELWTHRPSWAKNVEKFTAIGKQVFFTV